jgi:hypothetical protein
MGTYWSVILNAAGSEEVWLCEGHSAWNIVSRRGAGYRSPLFEFLRRMRGVSCGRCGVDGCIVHYLLAVVIVAVAFVFVTLYSIMTCVLRVRTQELLCIQDLCMFLY